MTDIDTWLSTPEDIRQFRDELEASGRRLVFTNGCFDILHAGHVRYLNQARELGDALVIALNSDESVKVLKGPTRPVNNQEDRAEVLMGLQAVSGVVLFTDARATALIDAIKPHIYAKGGDYTVETLNAEEREALERAGSEIHILPLVPGRSTTSTLERIQAKAAPPFSGKLRLAVLGSGQGSNFAAIQQAIEDGKLNAEIVVVMSDIPGSQILSKADEASIPYLYINPGSNPNKLDATAQEEIRDELLARDVHVVVLAGFMRLLKAPVLQEFTDRIVNIHPSLLPKFKGKEAWVQALDEGEIETGCTVHLVNAEVDSGRILAQTVVPIEIGDTPETLLERIHKAEHELLPRVLSEWVSLGLPVS